MSAQSLFAQTNSSSWQSYQIGFLFTVDFFMLTGRYKLHRQSQENELYFLEPFTKRQAWNDLLLTTAFKDWKILVRGNVIEVKKWQNWYSERTLAERRQWSRDKVRRFLNYLETIQQVEQQKSKVKSIITIINREKYQWNDTTDNTTDRPQTIPQTDTIKKYNKVKEIKESIYTEDFENFRKVYPRKKWKLKAMEARLKAIRKIEPSKIIESATKYAQECRVMMTPDDKIKRPQGRLNDERRDDEYKTNIRKDGFTLL